VDRWASRVDDGRRGEEILEDAQITVLCGDPERVHETLLLSAAWRPTLRDRDVLAGATHELTGVGFADPQQARDPRVRVVERVTQNVRDSLGRPEPLDQHEEPEFESLSSLDSEPGIVRCVDRLSQPPADV